MVLANMYKHIGTMCSPMYLLWRRTQRACGHSLSVVSASGVLPVVEGTGGPGAVPGGRVWR